MKPAKPMEYMLEVFEPGSFYDVWVAFSSSSPFMAMHAGDILNPGIWDGSQSPAKVLRIVNVEHIIWETPSHVKHKVEVYTQEVEGSAETRMERE